MAEIKKNKTLFFKNLFSSMDGKEDGDWYHQATLILASAFRRRGLAVELSEAKLPPHGSSIDEINYRDLEHILHTDKEINLVTITILEDCFQDVRCLAKFIKKNSQAFIVVGGIMPTLSPEHVMAHMPEADFLIRGEGENVLPELANAISGNFAGSKLSGKCLASLKRIKGLYFRYKEDIILSDAPGINFIEDMDGIHLDFSFLDKDNLKEGLNLSTSRGCRNSCYFCTMPQKGNFRAMSFLKLKAVLYDYHQRLLELYGQESLIPDSAYKLSFNDDDFLGDRQRAIDLFRHLKDTRFRINFIQAAVNSFFIYKDKRSSNEIDSELIDSMDPVVFYNNPDGKKDRYSVYIGTENFCDQELKRLGKGYGYEKIEKMTAALSARGIRQAHHLILTNIETSLDDVFENYRKISILKARYGGLFNILHPVMPGLVSLYPSSSFRIYSQRGLTKQIKFKAILHNDKYRNLNYPLVKKDIPLDPDVAFISDNSEEIFSGGDDYEKIYPRTLRLLLATLEDLKLNSQDGVRIKKLESVLEKQHNYAQDVRQKLNEGEKMRVFRHDKNNLQIMLTRRCHLRCAYCPIPKKDADMELATLRRSIELLFDSSNDNIRIDFTGGEPLLRFDLMREGIEYARFLAKQKKKKVSFYIVTNALELSPDVADFLDNKNVLLEVSIDGNEITHNKYKIPLDKNINSYAQTTSNIANIKNKNIDMYVVLVATPDTVAGLSDNLEHIISLGHKHIEVNYAIGRYWDQASKLKFFSELEGFCSCHEAEIRRGELILGNLGKRNEPAVLNGEFMIDTDGRIRPLNEFLLRSSHRSESPYFYQTVFDYKRLEDLFIDDFTVYYSLTRMFCENDTELRRILKNNIEMGIESSLFSRGLAEKIGISGAGSKIHSIADLMEFFVGRGEILPELDTKRPEVVAMYRQAEKAFRGGASLFQKKMSALDQALVSLLYNRENMILKNYYPDIIDKYSGIIERYIDYPKQLSANFGISPRELPYSEDRLVALVTHSCQLDCTYCSVKKFQAEMDEDTLKRAIDLLFTSSRRELELQFFGGEPLLRLDLVRAGVKYARQRSLETAKSIRFLLTTNGLLLDEKTIEYFVSEDFTIELSLDGDMKTQLKQRRSRNGENYYARVLENMKKAEVAGLRHYVISVVTPENVGKMFDNFRFLAGEGFRGIQLNYALGTFWDQQSQEVFFVELDKIMKYAEKDVMGANLVNALKARREPVVLNAEITVDCDGGLFLETGICLEQDFEKLKNDFNLGTLDTVVDMRTIFNTRSRNLKALIDVYSREHEEFRKIIINNVALGIKLSRFFASQKNYFSSSDYNDLSSNDLVPKVSVTKKRTLSDSVFQSLAPGYYLVYNILFDYDVYEKKGKCDNQCIFCCDAGKDFKDGGDNEDKRHINIKKNLMLCAGEPANLQNILEIIESFKPKYRFISMTSNGRRFKDMDFARKLINSGISELEISLHGPNRQIHDEISGMKGSFDDTVKGIENIITLMQGGCGNISLTVNYVITLGNLNHINEFVRLMADKGVRYLHFSPLLPMGRGKDIYRDQMADFKDILAKFRKLKEDHSIPDLESMRIILSKVPYCVAEKYSPEVFGYMYCEASEKHDEEGARHQDFCFDCRYGNYCEGVADEYVDIFGWPVSRQNQFGF